MPPRRSLLVCPVASVLAVSTSRCCRRALNTSEVVESTPHVSHRYCRPQARVTSIESGITRQRPLSVATHWHLRSATLLVCPTGVGIAHPVRAKCCASSIWCCMSHVGTLAFPCRIRAWFLCLVACLNDGYEFWESCAFCSLDRMCQGGWQSVI